MISRERVITALNHKEPDRIPFDLDGTNQSGIHSVAYQRLLSLLEIEKEETNIYDPIQQLARIDEDILQRLNVDTRMVLSGNSSKWKLKIKKDKEGEHFINEYGITWNRHKGGMYFDPKGHPLANATVEDLENYSWPDSSDLARVKGMKEEAARLHQTGYPVGIMNISGGFFEIGFWLHGYENFYCDLAGNPDYACAQMDKCLEIEMKYWDLILLEMGDDIDVVLTANDLGSQSGPMISLEMFRKYIKPRMKKLNSFIKKKKPDVYIFFHSCGSIYDLIPDIIETGVDIINPVQVSANKMDTKRLKKEFGDALTFWGGGIDTQKVLPCGTPSEIRDEVKRRIDDLAPGGGFVFATVHNIQPDVPPENIMAMWEALQEYGKY